MAARFRARISCAPNSTARADADDVARHNRRMPVSAYLKFSIIVALATIALRTAAWWLTGSVALLSDALEGLVNLAGAMFALTMVIIAQRPADEGHPYGHFKAEYFS